MSKQRISYYYTKKYQWIFPYIVLLILSSLFGLTLSCKADKLEDRIRRVENGLLIPIKAKGKQPEKMRLTDRMKYYKVPGVSIAVINNYKIEWAKGYGFLEARGNRTVTSENLFQAASISKPVTAMAALYMVQEGLIDLDEDVNNKLVSWKVPENEFAAKKKVTLRELLSHCAGVTVSGFRGYAEGEEIPILRQILNGEKPANSPSIRVDMLPGSKFRYSGGGYCIIQQLLTDLNGKSFPIIIDEIILNPLKMRHSTFSQPLPDDRRGVAATGHGINGKPIKGKWHTYPEMAAAGLWTTPSDLARFAIELMLSRTGKSNKVLSQDMTNQMLTPIYTNYGLGIIIRIGAKELHFLHSGGNMGFRCIFIAYPDRGRGAAIMTNSENGERLNLEILHSILREYGWGDLQL